MKKKIILTILLGAVITYFIYQKFYHEEMNIVTLGDSISLGMTPYNVEGYSFNDYLKDIYENNNLEEYITEFSSINETTETLLLKIQNNYTLESTNLQIQQAIAKANILTLSLGIDELSSKSIIKTKDMEGYIKNMEKIIKLLRIYNDKSIFLISLYPTNKLKKDKISDINNKLKEICHENNIIFIDIESISDNQEYFFEKDYYHLNYKGHRYISNLICYLL